MIENIEQKERLLLVLERYTELVKDCEDEEDISFMSHQMERMLNEMCFDDFFGTERQLDPRGSLQDDNYDMYFVQGYDD